MNADAIKEKINETQIINYEMSPIEFNFAWLRKTFRSCSKQKLDNA